MKKYLAIPLLLAVASTSNAGSLDSYVEKVLLKDCADIVKSVKATNALFQNGKVTYTDTYTFTCFNKYAYRFRWTGTAVSYRVLFWKGVFSEPIVVETKYPSVVQMLDYGTWTMQIESLDVLGNSTFSNPITIEAKK